MKTTKKNDENYCNGQRFKNFVVQLSTTDPKKTITTKLSSVELFWFIRFDIKISATDCGYKVTIFNLEKKKKNFAIIQPSSVVTMLPFIQRLR